MISDFRGKFAFLANSYPCPVEMDGACYPCAETAFYAARCAYKTDRKKFATLSGPDARKLAGHLTEQSGWADKKLSVLQEVLQAKFSEPQLKRRLLQTGNEELVFSNPYDSYLGVSDGKGANHLGRLLMELRDEFRKSVEGTGPSEKQVSFLYRDTDATQALAVLGLLPEDLSKGLACRIIKHRIAVNKKEEI